MKLQNLHPSRRVRLDLVRKALRRYRSGALKAEIFLTDDRRISKLHAQFLGDDRSTDVMSFPSEDGGEVIISLDTAIRQAKERKIPLQWELILLAVHGLLHLQKYRDLKLDDWKQMRIAEFETVVRLL